MTPEQAAALTEIPELQRLIDLRDAGWMFLPTVVDGEIVQVHGVRTWPEGWADALRACYTTDAAGLRNGLKGEFWPRLRMCSGPTGLIVKLVPGSSGPSKVVGGGCRRC